MEDLISMSKKRDKTRKESIVVAEIPLQLTENKKRSSRRFVAEDIDGNDYK